MYNLDYKSPGQVLSSEFVVFMQSLPEHWQEKVSGAVSAHQPAGDARGGGDLA
jgi:hypothetical protein